MHETALPPTPDLLDTMRECFDLEGLRTLCYYLRVDYDDLPAVGKQGKARELILFMLRHSREAELKATMNRVYSSLGTTSAADQVQRTQVSTLTNAQPDAHNTIPLCKQIEMWEKIRVELRKVMFAFSPCRCDALTLGNMVGSTPNAQCERERLLNIIQDHWEGCKESIRDLKDRVTDFHNIGWSDEGKSVFGLEKFRELWEREVNVYEAVSGGGPRLVSTLSGFYWLVHTLLVDVDKELLNLVGQLP